MRIDTFYVIRGKAALRARLASWSLDIADILADAQLWQRPEGGRTAWGEKEFVASTKILYVLHMSETYASSEFGDRIIELLGPLPYSTATFDAWWELERYAGVDERAEDVLRTLKPDKFALVAPTGLPLVDQWVREVRSGELRRL